ncbi:MAG: CCA tRNA nucleotidyltransferase [Sulfitobacter sp.]
MVRQNDILIPADTRWLIDPDAQAVCSAVGGPIYFVGGCVRNALMGLLDSDVDMSTAVHPETVMQRAQAAGLKAVPTGIEHGTVTIVSGGKGFEVTTFRRDVETDGRRAVVAFSDSIEEDARRRDFTMNALYARPDGVVIDPLGGLADLEARRVRFIDDAAARIREDYLRTLRYFRFHAWYGADDEGFDPEALAAISMHLDGLETLSAERVTAELAKLLAAPDPCFAVAGMRSTGVLPALLPGADDGLLGPLVHNEMLAGVAPDWLRRFAVMAGEEASAGLRFSKADRKRMALLRAHGFDAVPLPELAYRHGAALAVDALLLRAALSNRAVAASELAPLRHAAEQRFPVRAADLPDHISGPALGAKLRALEQMWIDSGFTLDQRSLLMRV